MTPAYGRAPRGVRVHGAVPHGSWQITTLLGALGLDGVRAAMTVEAATDTDVFVVFVSEVLAPALRPGDVVIWDNLAPHKAAQAQAAVEAVGAHLQFLPPYSPDFNPIELCWSKVKQQLRSASARTTGSLHRAIGEALAAVTASDARGWFRFRGYQVLRA
jgi:transposase